MSYKRSYKDSVDLADKILATVRDPSTKATKMGLGAKPTSGRGKAILEESLDGTSITPPQQTVSSYIAGIKQSFSSEDISKLMQELEYEVASAEGDFEVPDIGDTRPQDRVDVLSKNVKLSDKVDLPTLASGIRAAAEQLGADPLDLATIISYETAGTLNPTHPGPTTKWGLHRGLIQFGEPQAKTFGVDWEDPYNSQLGPDGAVVKYFLNSGYKEGMGLLDMYSIVNAGGPGRYDWSDTKAGGAPGTVRDKVEKQMDGHRAKAKRLLEDY